MSTYIKCVTKSVYVDYDDDAGGIDNMGAGGRGYWEGSLTVYTLWPLLLLELVE